MMNDKAELINALADVIGRIVDNLVVEKIKPLQEELRLIKSLQDEWVDTREAMKITGIKKAQTLKAERERPGTVLVVQFEGDCQKSPRYSRASLLEYSAKKVKRRSAGRALAA